MRKHEVEIGAVYKVRLHGNYTEVRINSVSSLGGWFATNLATGRTVRIKSAGKLRERVS